MPTLKQRIDELETKIATDVPTPMFVRFVGTDGMKPMTRIVRGSHEWLVQPGETDEAFKARVLREDDLPAVKNCGRLFICC